MKMTSPCDPAMLSSPFSSPNVSALLQIKILSWSQETGFPLCVSVRIADRTFNLHKHPLTSKSGYFREKLKESNEVELPPCFPGGASTFEIIALFIYGSSYSSTLVDVDVNPFNIASLRCAAEFLHMTQEFNLCQRFDIYLNQVILQSWDHTLIVLRKCQTLIPLAEELLIVSRCIETLAFMACMEILDPERRRDLHMEALWIRDLIALPLAFFKRFIGSLRRHGMKEKYVSPIIVFYAHNWMRSKDEDLLQGIIDLLPPMGSKVIPVGFYFCLLWTCIEVGLRNESVEKLKKQTASMLHLAQLEDFLLPRDDATTELSTMETIFSTYYNNVDLGNNYVVAELWDIYLNQIAIDSELGCRRFMNLIETVPVSSRETHDHLYRALNTFFLSHSNLSQEEKGLVCKYLNCHKLSQQVCIEAVQNELMPLRLIVQALFVQQINTQLAFKDSFRYTEFSGNISSSIYANSKTHSPYTSEGCSSLFGAESISRIQNLEKELISLKKTLQSQQNEKSIGRQVLKSSVNFASNGLLKVLRRISLFGRGRSKRKHSTMRSV